MRKRIIYTLVVSIVVFLSSCGETAEEISAGMDHEVPSYKVLTDSLVVSPLQEVQLKVEISDNAGLSRIVFSYGNWGLNSAINIEGSPKTHLFETTVTIPQDAAKEWVESVTENDGTIVQKSQTYHKLVLTATDINMNVKAIPIYIKVI